MTRKNSRQTAGALEIPIPWFRSVAGLWLLALAVLGFVSLDSSYSGPDRWVVDGSMHTAIFLALTLAPALFVRTARYLAVTGIFVLGLALGLEAAQAVINGDHLEYGDIFANLLGVALGIGLAGIVRWKIHGMRAGAATSTRSS